MRGILIVNTGTPNSPNKKDVEEFIGTMLSDPMLMSAVPDWFRPILAKRIIAPVRAPKSAAHYSLIWNKEPFASPLILHTQNLAKKVEESSGLPVVYAMRYGMPDVSLALDLLEEKCSTLHEVVVVPMFPHYAQSSYQTTVDEVAKHFYKQPRPFKLKIAEPFYNHIGYIKALAESLRPFVRKEYDRLIFSFHSLPLAHVDAAWHKGKAFDYVYQIKETIRLVSKELELDVKKNRILYSSAIGNKWLKPGLDETMRTLPSLGAKKIIVLTAGFPADNLESLFDVDINAREIFMKHGGEDFQFVPGLNSTEPWVEGVIKIVTSMI
ncbi:ferrochelatase [Dysgonomonas sp. PH5-45]|uniref:ferrochelatase n=1 Tax=unclassified Dysgonomonas TaxID=2630389 RepID=UPI00247345F6|nr:MULTISPECIES: ferrochelatase [unclassified Dysgonomonas]MDH6354329.1 ferrochelatase [Dysgonomonas sp. PH5-45]MDH6387229.1 ferrochelatase [Dysgonomonas sp. PH5-37]